MDSKHFKIDNKKVGINEPTYFIADIAANHDGDLEKAKDLIYLAAEAGADAAKFQHFAAETIVSDFGFKNLKQKLSHQANWEKSVYSVYDDASVNLDWTLELKKTCRSANISFFTTPYSLEVIDYLDKHIPAFKIGSGDITWTALIEKVAKKNKPFFLAAGASNIKEVVEAVETSLSLNKKFCLMQCNTNYTASLENFHYINLNVLKTFQNLFPHVLLGLSDHTPGHSTVLGAIALGARAIEKHFTNNTYAEGPDHKFSMDPATWKEMVQRSRELESALGEGVKKVEDNEKETVIVQRRALRSISNLRKGKKIEMGDFIPLRPCPIDALNLSETQNIIGKFLKREISKGDYLKVSDFAE